MRTPSRKDADRNRERSIGFFGIFRGDLDLRESIAAFIAVCETIGTPVVAHRAFVEWSNPPRFWQGGSMWYEQAVQSLCMGMIGVACWIYLARRAHERHLFSVGEIDAIPRPRRWRDKKELRFVLFTYAIFFGFLYLPLGILKAYQASQWPSGPFRPPAFSSEIEPGWFVYPILGIAILAYDRWRLKHDDPRIDTGRCLTCGYDLRATPDRCPECGSKTEMNAETQRRREIPS